MAKAKFHTRYNLGCGAIYQRKTKKGNVRWYLDFHGPDHRRIQRVVRNAQTKEDALIALQQEASRSFDNEFGVKRKAERLLFSQLVGLYLQDYAKINKRSWKTDRSYLKSMERTFSKLYLDEINPLYIERYKAERLSGGLRPSTVNRCLAIMRKALNLAVEWGFLDRNQVPRIKLLPEKDNMMEKILSGEEENRLLGACSSNLRPILIIALNTGMRLGEILGLRWSQVDFQAKRIRVERTKSGKVRHIEANTPLLRELLGLKSLDGQSGYVFLNSRTGKPLTTVKTAFKVACRRAGISGLRFHDLRHTFASRLVLLGVDPITVRNLLGHSSVRITERYTHTNQEQKRNAVELLEAKPAKDPQKETVPLHICDTAASAKESRRISPSLSVN